MVGLVLVSHSKQLADAVRELVLQMAGPAFPVAVAAGVGDDYADLGTDAVHIAEVVQKLTSPDGVLVLMDLGSAVLSAQTALELLDSPTLRPVRLCSAPLVEGAIAAAVSAQGGSSLAEVAAEAERGLAAKQQQLQLQPDDAAELPSATTHCVITQPDETAEIELVIENQHGLHARPAAALVQMASRFSSTIAVSNLSTGKGPAPARSLTSLALLQIRKGDRIKVSCTGADCRAALEAIRELAGTGFGESLAAVFAPQRTKPVSEVQGVPGSDGIAIGPLALLQTADLQEENQPAGEPATELAKLTAAIQSVRNELLRGSQQNVEGRTSGDQVLKAQALILNDPVVMNALESAVHTRRLSASRAWIEVTNDLAAKYQAMDDSYFQERAADVRDIARRVGRRMVGNETQPSIRFSQPSILLSDELLPSEAAACEPESVLGVIAAKGSATSHSAIILRTLGIPMIVGASGISESDQGKTIAMNGSTGEFWIDPDAATIARLEESKRLQLQRKILVEAASRRPSITLDGARIQVLANAGNPSDAATAAQNGAEGIGLLRTEFLFASRREAPTEDEQVRALREVYSVISGPIIVRTLDVGADKPLPFLPPTQERNPYLGRRGIRLSLHSPELFLSHLRAILRSGAGHEIWLMFPMISRSQEVQQAVFLLEQAHSELENHSTPHLWPIKRGIMIEVPSAALCSEQLAESLDFFSIGTNDLTQYTMAAERGNSAVAELQDALHPAVLRLMQSVAQGARRRKCHVSVCGDAASDPQAAALFAGIGIHSLSVRPKQVAEIKALFRDLRLSDLTEIARQAMQCPEAVDVRRLIQTYIGGVNRCDRSAVSLCGFE
jgi:phosphoenolpyruvate-protein phosphotransferase/dihydroxyacetone kinase phosphotransfer subunit